MPEWRRTAQRVLEHANASMTLNIYSHLRPSAEDKTEPRLPALWPLPGSCGPWADFRGVLGR